MSDFTADDFIPWTDADRAADYGDLLGKPASIVACNTVDVTIHHNGMLVGEHTIPAYTRNEASLKGTVLGHLANYLDRSVYGSQSMSVAGFTLYLLAQAANEPTTQEGE